MLTASLAFVDSDVHGNIFASVSRYILSYFGEYMFSDTRKYAELHQKATFSISPTAHADVTREADLVRPVAKTSQKTDLRLAIFTIRPDRTQFLRVLLSSVLFAVTGAAAN